MQLLNELLADFRRLGNDDEDDLPPLPAGETGIEELTLDPDDTLEPTEGGYDLDSDEDIADTLDQTGDPEAPEEEYNLDAESDTDANIDGGEDVTDEDPNRAGLIRTVKNAHLVYKRRIEDGTFEELWIYNISSLRDELDVRKAILSGTDIPVSRIRSPDGTQTYSLWSAGNAEMLKIVGLPN